jgi:hypothetical protein
MDDDYRPLYRVGAAAAFAVLVLVPVQMFVFFRWPPPHAVIDWFALFQRSWLIGLVDMHLLLVVDQVLMGIVCVALFVALRRTSPSRMVLALALVGVAVATYIASNPALEMLQLSHRYHAASTYMDQLAALAAGETMVATSFTISYVLGAIAFLLIASVMLRGNVFSRLTGQVGVVFGLSSLVPASAGRLGAAFAMLSLLPMWLWLLLIGRRLAELGDDQVALTAP